VLVLQPAAANSITQIIRAIILKKPFFISCLLPIDKRVKIFQTDGALSLCRVFHLLSFGLVVSPFSPAPSSRDTSPFPPGKEKKQEKWDKREGVALSFVPHCRMIKKEKKQTKQDETREKNPPFPLYGFWRLKTLPHRKIFPRTEFFLSLPAYGFKAENSLVKKRFFCEWSHFFVNGNFSVKNLERNPYFVEKSSKTG